MNFISKSILVFFLASIFCLPVAVFPLPGEAITFKPQVEIPGTEIKKSGLEMKEGSGTEPIGIYIREVYRYAVGVVGILAAVVLMIGGFTYALAAGNQEKITQAKSYIVGALSGLILMMTSYLLLSFISTDLVNLKVTSIQKVEAEPIGVCNYSNMCVDLTEKQCKERNGNWNAGSCPSTCCVLPHGQSCAQVDDLAACEKLTKLTNPTHKDPGYCSVDRRGNKECVSSSDEVWGCCTSRYRREDFSLKDFKTKKDCDFKINHRDYSNVSFAAAQLCN